MVMITEEKQKPSEDSYEWQININEGFAVVVKSPNVEGALMQAFAKYWQVHPKPSLLLFEINVLNLTQYKASKAGRMGETR